MKRALKIVGIVIAVLIVIVLVLPFVVNVNDYRPRIESELTNALGRNVTVGNLSLSLWSGSLAADNIAIADDPSFSSSPFIKAQALNVGVEILPLVLSKTLHITDLTLTQPQVNLLRDRSGKWNFSTIGTASPTKKTGASPPSSAGQAPPASGTEATKTSPRLPARAQSKMRRKRLTQNLNLRSSRIYRWRSSASKMGKSPLQTPVKRNRMFIKM
ncbi:MAG TPA: AsmA family protein [Terriglobales bacterium]|nr:AsmA family protein [Terriglobales bacterium]